MRVEPQTKRVNAYVDGQNLFHAARRAFGYTVPNYDIQKLVREIAANHQWVVNRVCFYTGVPDRADNLVWNQFWSGKLSVLGKQGVQVFSRPLRYRNQTQRCPDCGREHTFLVGQEKGVDVRLALDIVRAVLNNDCDVILVFSQDQDLSEVADEVRLLSVQLDRWIKIACAFPVSPTTRNRYGIQKSDWIPIDRQMYDRCLDRRDYRAPGA